MLAGTRCDAAQLASAEAAIREIMPVLERSNVVLAVENNEAFSAAEYAALVERLGSPFVGICIDTANSVGRPELLETVLTHLAPHAVMLHAKDFSIRRVDTRMGLEVVGEPAGQGLVDFDRVFGELRECGRADISVIIEHWPPFAGTIQRTVELENAWLTESVRFLRAKLRIPAKPGRVPD